VPEEVLAVLRELDRADAEIGAALVEIDLLSAEVTSVRAKAEELATFAARLPHERERLAVEQERARAEASNAQRTLTEAEAAAATADADNRRAAERFQVRARDRVSATERRVAEAASAARELEGAASEMEIQGHELDTRARRLGAALRDRPRLAEDAGKEPAPGIEGIDAWSEVARASLYVARAQLSAERDAVIRQANELGALALGEPLTSLATAALRRRVEGACRDG